jgi:hypothetical protein
LTRSEKDSFGPSLRIEVQARDVLAGARRSSALSAANTEPPYAKAEASAVAAQFTAAGRSELILVNLPRAFACKIRPNGIQANERGSS